MNRADLLELPAVLDVVMAAKVLRVSRTQAYDLIRNGEWPTSVFRMGKLIRIPTAPLLEFVGIDERAPQPAAGTSLLASGQ